MNLPPEAWAREAERLQRVADRRRAEETRGRRTSVVEWLVIVLVLAGIVAALALGVRL